MAFYETLAAYYDELFPMETEILDFLKARLEKRLRILDIACGTGTYARALARAGFDVVAVDADPAMMRKAQDSSEGSSVLFLQGLMQDLSQTVSGTFNAAYCIGNSLPHLTDLSEVHRFFSDVFSLLRPEGRLIVQIINFDRILLHGISRLPTLSGGAVSMKRLYKRTDDPKTLLFETEITAGRGTEGENTTQAVPLAVLRKEELVSLAVEAGFVERETCGSYSGGAYEPDKSFLTILIADREG
jgi:glycine/sarcosine N-methyltransferase